jgi:diguanylate cyclase (GGDEF)-like protein
MNGDWSFLRMCAALSCCVVALLLSAAPAAATTTDLNPCLRSANSGETIAQVLANPGRFACNVDQAALPRGDYWARFAVPKSVETVGHPLTFRTASLWDSGLELAVVRKDGVVEQYRPFAAQDIAPLRLGGTVVVPIDEGRSPITMIYVKISQSEGMQGIILQSQLSLADDAIRFEMMLAVFYAAFTGLCIALLVYNLALWRGMGTPFLLAYCVMLVAALAYAFVTSGAAHYFSAALSGPERLRMTLVLLTINAATVMIFVRHFFEAPSIPKWLVRITYAHSAAMVAFSLVYAALAPAYVKLLDPIYVCSFIPLPAIVACYVAVAFRRRDPFLGYFLAAWCAPAIAIIARIAYGLGLLPYHILIENSTLMALAVEALISSLAIGKRIQMLAIGRDRAELAEARAMVIADTDALTGLPNRRAFIRTLLHEPREWQLVLVDVDHFKRINDTLGHVVGDEVLVTLATIINGFANGQSIVARLGGEEFAIATRTSGSAQMPDENGGLVDADRLLRLIRQAAMPGGYRITASIGVATRAICEEQDWIVLYRAADMALYRAKAEGRDRHVDYSMSRAAA